MLWEQHMCLAKKKKKQPQNWLTFAFRYLYVISRWKDLKKISIYSPETPFETLLKNVVMQEVGQPHSLV